MWYIVTKENRVVATCNVCPDLMDLKRRERRAVESDLALPLREAEFSNGKIRKKKVTKAEKIMREREEKRVIQHRIIDLRMRMKEAKAAGFDEMVDELDGQINELVERLEKR